MIVDYLDKDDIVFINKRTVSEHGGNFMPPANFLHEENLDYLLEAVQAEMFGEPLYQLRCTASTSLAITYSPMATNVPGLGQLLHS
ncbi:hypothetical protein [Arundinibacter roseus]|uniref:Uncharacterized protein n=1 Tax=Arundinibacter roseus TaxID=2070510 RepID=A0A4V2XAW2_9BACT|nr:hypothetical protein [Arundinibacter roseus]TDB69195.1 hypothetical protein EZE20_02355 [Arundinibacter roseus]